MKKHCQILKEICARGRNVNTDLFLEKKFEIENALNTQDGHSDIHVTLGRILSSCDCKCVEHAFIELSVYTLMFICSEALIDHEYLALLKAITIRTPRTSQNLKFQLLMRYLKRWKQQSTWIFSSILQKYSVQQKAFLWRSVHQDDSSVDPSCVLYARSLNALF